MTLRRLLVVDDDTDIRDALRDALTDTGHRVTTAENGTAAMRKLEQRSFDAVISDVQMEPLDGRALLGEIRAAHGDLPVVLMTAYGTVDEAVGSMLDGAAHYLQKPFDIAELKRLIARLCPEAGRPVGVVAESPVMRGTLETARLVAASDASVTISGESGTGKEVVARYIHSCSPRAQRPFVAINCAAIPENMLEAMLFGHVRGAFTGATGERPGKFEQAQHSTLLLDEISEMDLSLQAKLLRVVQEREVERIGARQPIALDVRIVATTNRDLAEEVAAGRFREDLYYRLNVFPLALPPLRARRPDILPLAGHLLQKHAATRRRVPELSAAGAERLCAHSWPGNVRELDNVIQRSLILARG
ncbi:MAG: sigma-54 dependent transcriptional regulator, partial [Pseudomonadota bacterium]